MGMIWCYLIGRSLTGDLVAQPFGLALQMGRPVTIGTFWATQKLFWKPLAMG